MLFRFAHNCLLTVSVLIAAITLPLSSGAYAQLNDSPPQEQDLAEAESGCQLQLDQPSAIFFRGARSRGYSGKDSRHHIERAGLKIRHSGGACGYILQIEPANGSYTPEMRSATDTLRFNIRAEGRQSGPSDQIIELHGRFYEGQVIKTAAFEVTVPTGQSVSAGNYSGDLTATLFLDNDGIREFISSGPLYVTTNVEPRVSASIGQDAYAGVQSANFDFGQLRSGKQKSINFAVDANTNYQVAFKSLNQGQLIHEYSSASLAYQVTIDGKALQRELLTDGTPVLRGQQSTRHDVGIEIIGNTATALAGNYSDLLTIVISAE